MAYIIPNNAFDKTDLDILQLLSNGLTAAEISEQIVIYKHGNNEDQQHLSVRTIEARISNMSARCGATNAVNLVATAIRNHVIW